MSKREQHLKSSVRERSHQFLVECSNQIKRQFLIYYQSFHRLMIPVIKKL